MKPFRFVRAAVKAGSAIFIACALAGCGGGGGGAGSAVPPGPGPTPGPSGTFPRSISLQLDRATAPVGTATTLSLTATALDDFGNLIKGTYTPAITVANDDTSGQVTLDKTTLTGGADAITVRYTGKLLQKPPVTFTVTRPVPGNPAVFTPDAWTRYGPTTNLAIFATTVGPDGNIWFTECGVLAGATCKLGKVSPSTGTLTESSDVGYAKGLVAGPDGNVWFTEGRTLVFGPSSTMYFSANVGAAPIWSMTTGGAVNRTPLTPPGASFDPALGTAAGGVMWGISGTNDGHAYASADGVASLSFAGAWTLYISLPPIPFGSTVGVSHGVLGPDGNLWFADGQGMVRFRLAL